MANDTSPTDLRGFIIPWPFTVDHIWRSQSTYTVLNPFPDFPEPQQESSLGLTAFGEFTSTEPLEIYTIKAGNIGDSGFAWKKESDTKYYGSDGAGAISRWESIIDGTSSGTQQNNLLQAISTKDGNQYILVESTNTSTQLQKIIVYKRSPLGVVSFQVLHSQDHSSIRSKGCITVLGDGSILAVYMKIDDSDKINLESKRSFDGNNWTFVSRRLIQEDLDGSGTFGAGAGGIQIERIRMAESLGQILLLVNAISYNTSLTNQNVVIQYSSTDNACTCIEVATTNADRYFSIEILVNNGQFQVFYIYDPDQSRFIYLENSTTPLDRALGHGATQPVLNGKFTICDTNPSHGYLEDGFQSVWQDDSGKYYAVYKDVGGGTLFFLMVSTDGENWVLSGHENNNSPTDSGLCSIYTIGSTSILPTEISGCSGAGRNFLFHNFDFSGTHNRGALHVFELGGWSTINLPALKEFPQFQERSSWVFDWVPYNSPDNTGHFTSVGSGTITQNVDDCTFLSAQATNPEIFVETSFFVTSSTQGVIVLSRCRAISEGRGDSGRGIQVQTTDRKVSVYIDTNRVALYDDYGSTQLAIQSVDTTTVDGIEILLSVTNNKARAWYRKGAPGEKKWEEIGFGNLASGASVANTKVRFGHLSSLSTPPALTDDLETEWYEFHYSYNNVTGLQLENEPHNPEDLNPLYYPPQGKTVYITGGTKISTFDSPGFYGERYKINETSTSPIRYIFTSSSRSPRQSYSSADTTAQSIALYLDTTLEENENSTLGSDGIGIHLSNINFRSIGLEYYNSTTSSWVSLGTHDNDIGGQFNFTRSGSTVFSSSVNGQFLDTDECKNWTLLLTNGGVTVAKQVKTNTQGTLDQGTNRQRCRLILEDAQTTDPTSGTAYLIPRSCTIILQQTASLAAIRITMGAQETAEGSFIIGNLVIGSLVVPQQYSRGRTITYEPGTSSTITPDGLEEVRSLHPGGRTYRISWSEGIDTSDLYDTNPDPDYYTLVGGGSEIGTPGASPNTVMGISKFCNGTNTPLVYLPQIPRASVTVINRRERAVLCSLQGEASIEHVLGDEFTGAGAGELYRVSTLILRELF